eukprot:m51a1_g5755 hypothetical protein (847) ;mRNA; r:1199473-1203436
MDLRSVMAALVALGRTGEAGAAAAAGPSSPGDDEEEGQPRTTDDRKRRSCVASVFSFVLKHAVLYNESCHAPHDPGSSFSRPVAPQLRLADYIERYFLYTRWGTELFVTALALMDRAVACPVGSDSLNAKNIRRFTLVSAKLLDDNCYTNTYVARVACVRPDELLELELELLARTSFSANVSAVVFERYWRLLRELEAAARASASCGGIAQHFRRLSSERDRWVQARCSPLLLDAPRRVPASSAASLPTPGVPGPRSGGHGALLEIAAARGTARTSRPTSGEPGGLHGCCGQSLVILQQIKQDPGPRTVLLLAFAAALSVALLSWDLSSSQFPGTDLPAPPLDYASSAHALLAAARARTDVATPHVRPFALQDNVIADGSFDVASVADSPWTAAGAGFSVQRSLGRTGSFTRRNAANAVSCAVLPRWGAAVQTVHLAAAAEGRTAVLLVVWSRPHGRRGRTSRRLGVANVTLSDSAGREVAAAQVDLAPATEADWRASWTTIEVAAPFDTVRVALYAEGPSGVRVDDVRVTLGTSARERAGIEALSAALNDTRAQEALGERWECGARPCLGRRFFQVWSTKPSTFTVVQLRSIESVLRHHRDACVCVYSEELPAWWFSELWYYGHNVRVGRPSPATIAQRIPATAPWVAQMSKWRSGKYWYAHYADWLRLALLYMYGGTYTDTDYVFLRELGSDGEPATNTTCTNVGPQIGGPPPWKTVDPPVISRHTGHSPPFSSFSLNNAFLSFDKGNKFPLYALERISRNYKSRCWSCNGPHTVTVGRLQPTSWRQAREYVVNAHEDLFAEVINSSTAVHLWNRAFETDKLSSTSFAHRILERSRITLFPLDS